MPSVTVKRQARLSRGFSLLEALIASMTVLICALIFASAMPLANASRGKAQLANVAMSIAQRQMEQIKHHGFANAEPGQMLASSLIDSANAVNLTTEVLYTNATQPGYEFSNVDSTLDASTVDLLPQGRAFVVFTDDSIDLRRVEVLVFWVERDERRFVKLTTYLANL